MITVTVLTKDEAPEALVADTLVATVKDMRIADRMYPKAQDSPVTHALRLWGEILPERGTNSYPFRMKYGWTEEEVEEVQELLLGSETAFKEMAAEPALALEGTRESLLRAAERVSSLRPRWERLLLNRSKS